MPPNQKWFDDLELLDRTLKAAGEEICEQVRNRPPPIGDRSTDQQWDYETEVRDGWAKPGTDRY